LSSFPSSAHPGHREQEQHDEKHDKQAADQENGRHASVKPCGRSKNIINDQCRKKSGYHRPTLLIQSHRQASQAPGVWKRQDCGTSTTRRRAIATHFGRTSDAIGRRRASISTNVAPPSGYWSSAPRPSYPPFGHPTRRFGPGGHHLEIHEFRFLIAGRSPLGPQRATHSGIGLPAGVSTVAFTVWSHSRY